MSRQVKLSLFIVILLASAAGVYRWSRSVKAPVFRVAAASAAPAPKVKPQVISPVDRVRNGTLVEYGNVTVGKAFEKTFQAPEWKVGVSLEGNPVVTFHGTASYASLKNAGFYIGTWNGVIQGIEAARQVAESAQRCGVDPAQMDESPVPPCLAKSYDAIVIPVTFEFVPGPANSVEMTSADAVFQTFDRDHRLRRNRPATLAFVYR